MTNQEFATELRALADFYEKEAPEGLKQPSLMILLLWDKAEVQAMARAVKPFTKELDGDHYTKIKSSRFPLLNISFNRDLFCKKIVTYDCEPLLSPEEDAELEEVGKS